MILCGVVIESGYIELSYINPHVLKFLGNRKFTGSPLFVEPNINQAVETRPHYILTCHCWRL